MVFHAAGEHHRTWLQRDGCAKERLRCQRSGHVPAQSQAAAARRMIRVGEEIEREERTAVSRAADGCRQRPGTDADQQERS